MKMNRRGRMTATSPARDGNAGGSVGESRAFGKHGDRSPRSKYGAVRTTVDGIQFDSKKEAARYAELKLLARAGTITALELQPEFPLCAGDDDTIIGCYRADFAYVDEAERWIVEDVKGVRTPLYRWKVKHLRAQYGIEITEV